MNPKAQKFRQNLAKLNVPKKLGKLIIISGISGSGKNVVADILVENEKFAFLSKYVTRVFRKNEVEEIKAGKSIGIKPVRGKYNDAQKTVEEQKQLSFARKQAFLDLRLPFCYVNYDEYYGFSKNELTTYLKNGIDVVAIINDISLVRDLKNLYEGNCLSCYVHRANPKNKDIFMQIAKQRGDTPESAEKRYQKAIKDFDRYTNNIALYDYTILNTENGTQKLSQMLKDLNTKDIKMLQQKKTNKQGNAKIYVFIGSPGSGKDQALETIRSQSILHSLIMPKLTNREKKDTDGEEMIFPDDERFNPNSCSLQYTNYGSTYWLNMQELQDRLNDGISSSLILSNKKALQKLKNTFPDETVFIYIHGLSKEEYAIQEKEHLEDEYVQMRLKDYEQADELYYTQWLDFNHVIVNNGDLTDLKLQIDNIMNYYEQGRDWSMEAIDHYLTTANKYLNPYQKNIGNDDYTKEEISL